MLPKNMYAIYSKMGLPDFPVDISEEVKDIFCTVSLCRTNPTFFINNFLEPCRRRYTKYDIYRDFDNQTFKTSEGLKGVDDCIDYMSEVRKQNVLTWSPTLAKLAQQLIYGKTTDHKVLVIIENDSAIAFEAFVKAMINDGDFDRPNREIMDANLKYIGIAFIPKDDLTPPKTLIVASGSSVHKGIEDEFTSQILPEPEKPLSKKELAQQKKQEKIMKKLLEKEKKKKSKSPTPEPEPNENDNTLVEEKDKNASFLKFEPDNKNDDSVMPMLNKIDSPRMTDKNDLEMNAVLADPYSSNIDNDFTKRESVRNVQKDPAPMSNYMNNLAPISNDRNYLPTNSVNVTSESRVYNPPASREEILKSADIKPASYFKPPKI